MTTTYVIILTSLSTAFLVLGIVFEGKLKKKKNEKSVLSLISEYEKLTRWGVSLIIATIVLNGANCYFSIKGANDSKKQHTNDTSKISFLIDASKDAKIQFQKKRYSDSTQILKLTELTVNNGLKSDSIKGAIVDNAVKAINEQRKIIEKDKENTFAHFQNEVEDNLIKMLVYYEEKHILFFNDTNLFITIRLNNSYITKYGTISSQRVIISNLSQASESVLAVNNYCDQIMNALPKSFEKKYLITNFLARIEETKNFLYPLYYKIRKLKSYKEFESFNITAPLPKNYRDELNNYLELDYMTGPKLK
jgi:hypothetical protein